MMYRFLCLALLPFMLQAQQPDLSLSILDKGLLINNYYLQRDNNAPQILLDVLGEPNREHRFDVYGELWVYDDEGLSFRFNEQGELLQAEVSCTPLRGEWKPADAFEGKLTLRGVAIDENLAPKRLWKLFPNKAIYSSRDWSQVAFANGVLKLEFFYPFQRYLNAADGWSSIRKLLITWPEEAPKAQAFYLKTNEMMLDERPAIESDYLAFQDLVFHGSVVEMVDTEELSELAETFMEDASQGRILFRQFRKLNPAALEEAALLEDVQKLLLLDAYQPAIELLERAVKEHKSSYALQLALGRSYWYRGKDKEALKALEEAQKLNPEETLEQKADDFAVKRLIEEIKAS